MAKNVVVIGTQWGDGGKGKIVNWLTDDSQGVVRFQRRAQRRSYTGYQRQEDRSASGSLGHPARRRDLLHRQRWRVITEALIKELDELPGAGIDAEARLKISEACPTDPSLSPGHRYGARSG